jgi:YHS domain-containing protein
MQSKIANVLAFSILTIAPSATLFLGAPAIAGISGSTSELNTDEHGLALRGYDPVAYFEDGKPTPGAPEFSASFGGARYLFASTAHRAAFLANPQKYVPAYGGFCATGTSFGEKVDTDPETGQVVDGRLYLNNGAKALEIFNKDRAGVISKADTNWPTVKDKAFEQ